MADIRRITDFHDPDLDIYARLTENQLRSGHGIPDRLFVAESPNVIHRALDAGYEPVSLLMEEKHIEGQAREIVSRCGNIPLYTADLSVLKELTGFPLTRGVLCAMKRRPLLTAAEAVGHARRIAVLEDVMNPTNMGAVFRSAAALGMDAVLITPAGTDPLYRRCVRVSMGAVFQIPWAYTSEDPETWPQAGIAALRQMGFLTAALALRDDPIPIDDPRIVRSEKLALVLGTEGSGLSRETIEQCDAVVRIPMSHGVDSLNVAAAAAVAFWAVCRKKPAL